MPPNKIPTPTKMSSEPRTIADSFYIEPEQPIDSQDGIRETTLIQVSGKRANQAFRSALKLHRENATLSESQILPPKGESHDDKKDSQQDVGKEAGHDDVVDQCRRAT